VLARVLAEALPHRQLPLGGVQGAVVQLVLRQEGLWGDLGGVMFWWGWVGVGVGVGWGWGWVGVGFGQGWVKVGGGVACGWGWVGVGFAFRWITGSIGCVPLRLVPPPPTQQPPPTSPYRPPSSPHLLELGARRVLQVLQVLDDLVAQPLHVLR